MDIKRNLLLVALSIVSYLMLLAWNEDYPAAGVSDDTINAPSVSITEQIPDAAQSTGETTDDLPQIPVAGATTTEQPTAVAQAAAPQNRLITVSTPKQLVTIDLLGGDIVELSLPDFPVSLETPDQPFRLLRQDAGMVYVAQSGLIGRNGPDASADGRPLYQSAETTYQVSLTMLQWIWSIPLLQESASPSALCSMPATT